MVLHALAEGLIAVDRIRQVLPNFNDQEIITETKESPSPTELLAMPADERELWVQRSFELAANQEFEVFEAFGEEHF